MNTDYTALAATVDETWMEFQHGTTPAAALIEYASPAAEIRVRYIMQSLDTGHTVHYTEDPTVTFTRHDSRYARLRNGFLEEELDTAQMAMCCLVSTRGPGALTVPGRTGD